MNCRSIYGFTPPPSPKINPCSLQANGYDGRRGFCTPVHPFFHWRLSLSLSDGLYMILLTCTLRQMICNLPHDTLPLAPSLLIRTLHHKSSYFTSQCTIGEKLHLPFVLLAYHASVWTGFAIEIPTAFISHRRAWYTFTPHTLTVGGLRFHKVVLWVTVWYRQSFGLLYYKSIIKF